MPSRTVQEFYREAEEYARSVVSLMAADESKRDAAAARVVERLSTVLEGMEDGMSPEDMALALGS